MNITRTNFQRPQQAKPQVKQAAPEPTPHDTKEIEDFLVSRRPFNGILLNAPTKAREPQAATAEEYLTGVIDRLAGDRLKKEGVHLRLSLLSKDHFQAFTEGHMKGAGLDPERPSDFDRLTPWAVRKYSGFGQDGKPMYELGWHMGNFETLKSEEEIAFVLAHELSSIFEGQVSLGRGGHGLKPSFGSSNVAQLVADQHAIDMMVDAGYGTDGALTSLNTVLKDHGRFPAQITFSNGQMSTRGNSHHPGVRISAAQGKVESVHNLNPGVRPGAPQTEIPEGLREIGEFDDPYRRDDMRRMKTALDGIVADYFFKDEPLPWLDSSSPSEDDRFRVFEDVRPWPQEFGSAVAEALPVLETSPASNQKKVNAFFRLIRFGLNKTGSTGRSLSFTPEEETRIVDFLSRHSVGEMGWKYDGFIEQFEGDAGGGWRPVPYPHSSFAKNVLTAPGFESMLATMESQNSQWSKLIAKAPGFIMTNPMDGQKTLTYWLGDFASKVANSEEGPLSRVHSRNIVEEVKGLDLENLATSAGEHPGFHLYFPPLYRKLTEKKDDTDYAHGNEQREILGELLVPHAQSFGDYRDELLLNTLSEIGLDEKNLEFGGAVVRETMQAADVDDFSPETEQKLGKKLVEFVLRANEREDFIHTREPNLSFGTVTRHSQGLGTMSRDSELGEKLIALLSDDSLKLQEKEAILHFLCCDHPPLKSLKSKGQELKMDTLADHMKSLGGAQILERSERLHRQHDTRLIQLIGERYGLDWVDLDPEGLSALAEEVKAERLKPEGNGMQNSSAIQAVAAKEFGAQLSPLTFSGFEKELSGHLSSQVSSDQFESSLKAIEKAARRFEDLETLAAGREVDARISFASSRFLLDSLLQNKGDYEPFEFFERVTRVLNLNDQALDAREEYRQEFEEVLMPSLNQLPQPKLRANLQKPYMLNILSSENVAEFATNLAGPEQDTTELAAGVKQVDQELKLSEDHPGTHQLFQEKIAKRANLQPGEISTVFPSDNRTDSEKNSPRALEVRGISGLVGITRDRTPQEQIAMIEYMMGRQDEAPGFLLEKAAELEEAGPLMEVVRRSRAQLRTADVMTRVLTANSFLAGPSGFIRKPGGMQKMIDHLLVSVRPQNKELAQRLAEALVDSQGHTDSLAMAYVLGQRPSEDGELDEAAVLSNLFDAYGVPGIKLKQYLAFTSEFAEYREAFEAAQDSANPITYLDAIRLLDERFKGEWPEDLEIDKILGSGSVNVAIRYKDTKTGKKEVVQVGRSQIEATTQYDFFRFNRLLKSLTNTPEDKEKFGFLLGLTEIIKNSVGLELDKEAALEMQQSVVPLYKQKVNGWEISSVPAHRQENLSLFMDLAKGKTARRLAADNPEMYKEAMAAISGVEFNALLGIDQERGSKPVALHANPDFHDGQVLIDPETKSVTILDFGQAVKITNEERDLAIDLLGIMTGVEGVNGGLKVLNKLVDPANPIEQEELQTIRSQRDDPMDAFVHLLSLIGRHGGEVPMSSVHWIMGVNRQMALGDKIDVSHRAKVLNLLVMDDLGYSLQAHNRIHLLRENAVSVGQKVAGAVGGFLSWVNPFD